MLWTLIVACDPIQGDDRNEDSGLFSGTFQYRDTGDGGWSDWVTDGSETTDDPKTDEQPVDYDNDGWTEQDGDCDDHNDEVNPAVAVDVCDLVDNDCDGDIDEDFDEDSYEPNEGPGYDLGDLTGQEDVVYGFLYPSYEIDTFEFYVTDHWADWFGIEVALTGVPFEADLGLNLMKLNEDTGEWELLEQADGAGNGGSESVSYPGNYGGEDTGFYSVVIYSGTGESCIESYALEISA